MMSVRQIVRPIARRLLPPRMKEAIRLYRKLDAALDIPELLEIPPGNRVLVLAPHMDDEVIGCGGTLAKHVNKGCEVTVAILTDGSLGDPVSEALQLQKTARSEARTKLSELRKNESRAAAKCLGVQDIQFLDFPDGSLGNALGAREAVAALIADRRPEVLYIPFITERHKDHRAAAELAVALASNLPDLLVVSYAVWNPLHATLMIDITAQIDQKHEALNCFSSQLRHNDYRHATLGLNAFWSMYHLNGRGFAEAFFAVPVRIFADIATAVWGWRT